MKKIFLGIGLVMLLVAVIFVLYCLNHPTFSWTFDLSIVYTMYISYLIIMVLMFILSFIKRK